MIYFSQSAFKALYLKDSRIRAGWTIDEVQKRMEADSIKLSAAAYSRIENNKSQFRKELFPAFLKMSGQSFNQDPGLIEDIRCLLGRFYQEVLLYSIKESSDRFQEIVREQKDLYLNSFGRFQYRIMDFWLLSFTSEENTVEREIKYMETIIQAEKETEYYVLSYDEASLFYLIAALYWIREEKPKKALKYLDQARTGSDHKQFPCFEALIEYTWLSCLPVQEDPIQALRACEKLHWLFLQEHCQWRCFGTDNLKIIYLSRSGLKKQAVILAKRLLMDCKALESKRMTVTVLSNLVWALVCDEQFEEALEYSRQLDLVIPKEMNSWIYRPYCYYQLNNPQKALIWTEKVLKENYSGYEMRFVKLLKSLLLDWEKTFLAQAEELEQYADSNQISELADWVLCLKIDYAKKTRNTSLENELTALKKQRELDLLYTIRDYPDI